MNKEVTLRIILERPVSGVEYGIQKGKGNKYETIQKQTANSDDLKFEISIGVKAVANEPPVFTGPFAQGNPQDRFIYIDIGACAGQYNTQWSRRLKIPLNSISQTLINDLSTQQVLVTK